MSLPDARWICASDRWTKEEGIDAAFGSHCRRTRHTGGGDGEELLGGELGGAKAEAVLQVAADDPRELDVELLELLRAGSAAIEQRLQLAHGDLVGGLPAALLAEPPPVA